MPPFRRAACQFSLWNYYSTHFVVCKGLFKNIFRFREIFFQDQFASERREQSGKGECERREEAASLLGGIAGRAKVQRENGHSIHGGVTPAKTIARAEVNGAADSRLDAPECLPQGKSYRQISSQGGLGAIAANGYTELRGNASLVLPLGSGQLLRR